MSEIKAFKRFGSMSPSINDELLCKLTESPFALILLQVSFANSVGKWGNV